MKSVKKDWNYDVIRSFRNAQLIVLAIGVILIILKFFVNEDFGLLISGIYANTFMIAIVICFLYPIFVLKNIVPQIGSKKSYMPTSNITLTKKELFITEVKSSIMPMIIFLVVGSIIDKILFVEGDIITTISYIVDAFLVSLIIFFQTFIATILSMIKGFKKKKGMGVILGFDLILALIFLYIQKFFNDPAMFLLVAGGTVFVLSFIGFIRYWNDIEKVCN
ncbi:MAG: hypothetical protein ACRC6T_06450 [Sarcina sp.]